MIFGIIIIIFGILILLKNLGVIYLPIAFWPLFYPLVFILVGLFLVLGIHKLKKYWRQLAGLFLGAREDQH